MPTTTAILSLLHEAPSPRNSATRLFRNRPVLAWTLERMRRSSQIDQIAIICWDDQQAAINEIAADAQAHVLVKTPRTAIPALDQVSAAQRWSDGWRGGLLGTCHFDRGFHAPYVQEALAHLKTEDSETAAERLILLVDPASALVDSNLIDALIAHADCHPHREFFFTQAAAGLAGVLLRPSFLDRLAKSNAHPGRVLAYSPDLPGLDPVTNDMCVVVPPAIARTLHRFALDSDRQIRRLTAASADLNGHLMASDAEKLVAILDAYPHDDSSPREIVLELTTRRTAHPIFAPGTHLQLGRGDMPFESVRRIIDGLTGIDDARLTLAGSGDPLLHEQFPEILRLITAARIPAVHIETDLVDVSPAVLDGISEARIDMLSIHLPAIVPPTYQRIMGIDGYAKVIENLKRVLARKLCLPLLVPTFTKCRENLAEMETWYDHWLRVLGAAVIVGPTDYAGQIADHAAADMSPPRRRPCARLQSRMTILSDASISSCEQDILAKQAMGNADRDHLTDVWQSGFVRLRQAHQSNQLQSYPLCSTCKEWHRP